MTETVFSSEFGTYTRLGMSRTDGASLPAVVSAYRLSGGGTVVGGTIVAGTVVVGGVVVVGCVFVGAVSDAGGADVAASERAVAADSDVATAASLGALHAPATSTMAINAGAV
jgi:hypothetical protein